MTGRPGPDGEAPEGAGRQAGAGAGGEPAEQPGPDAPRSHLRLPARLGLRQQARRLSAGVYGTIVTAAILASAGTHLPTTELAVSVLVTLTVYWIAEEYADLLGDQIAGARPPGWRQIRTALSVSWTMVSASYLPLVVLLLATWAGATATDAASAALIAAAVEMVVYALAAGQAAALRSRPRFVVAASAAVLGVAMIALKVFVLTRLH